MTSIVWCEWICSQCRELHRMRFELVVSLKAAYQLKGFIFERQGVYVQDIALSSRQKHMKKGKMKSASKVFAKWDVEIERIIKAVREYMLEYYAVEKNTLKVEVCRSEGV